MNFKKFSILAVLALVLVAAMPAAAQSAPANTITVTGSAVVNGTPDQASIDLGVDVFAKSVSDSFATANNTLRDINDALLALGIAQEDIQTSNLSVYSTTRYTPEAGDEAGYQISNTVSVTIRDVDQVDAVIDAAINAGATNMYGLNFSIKDAAPLETQARAAAVQQAQARAAELAGLLGVELGNVVSISETYGGTPVFAADMRAQAEGMGGGAFVTPGTSSVNVDVTLTFEIVR